MYNEDVLQSTGIATALATSVSLLVSLWWRRADRKEADWIIYSAISEWGMAHQGETVDPKVRCQLANVGDATAFRVRVKGFDCKTWLWEPKEGMGRYVGGPQLALVPAIASGNQLSLAIWCDPKGWTEAFMAVSWVASPTRRRWRSRRAQIIRLSDIAPTPEYEDVGEMDKATGSYPVPVIGSPPTDWAMRDDLGPDSLLKPGSPLWWQRWRARRKAMAAAFR